MRVVIPKGQVISKRKAAELFDVPYKALCAVVAANRIPIVVIGRSHGLDQRGLDRLAPLMEAYREAIPAA